MSDTVIKVTKDVRIPGTNIIVEKGDKVVYSDKNKNKNKTKR